jgi:acetylornithine deacetylase/succinyl-diaminopimelate desuccinylase family protein
MSHPRTVIELLQDLVAIPSVNPHGDPGTDRTGEAEVAGYVADFLRRCGAEVEVREVSPGRPNVLAHFPSARPRARLAFAPHLDTVSVAGMTIPPFEPTVRNGKLFGRGTTDAKGPMAAALWAVHEWAQSKERAASSIEWSLLGLMNEEAGGTGAQAVADSGFKSDLILVLEPTEMALITAQKGVLWLEISTQGRACHGSTPELGSSAIEAMSEILRVVYSELIPQLAQVSDSAQGHATLNIGTITGGAKINMVPDRCRIEVDCRCLPTQNLDKIQALIEERVRRVVPEASIVVPRRARPLQTPETLPWVARLGEEANGIGSSPWSSDAGVLSAPHSPSVCIGPGHIAQAHTADEFISVADLESGAAFFRRWIAVAEEAAHSI